MLLNDEAGCGGADNYGALAPICRGCARYMRTGHEYIRPPATLEQGEWQCLERRSRGHVTEWAPDVHQGQHLTVGGA